MKNNVKSSSERKKLKNIYSYYLFDDKVAANGVSLQQQTTEYP